MSGAQNQHASCVIVGESGILIRGRSGSGKSSLALALIERAERFGRLVADDRVVIEARNGRLIGRPHPAVAGLLEIRGLGLVRRPSEPAAVIRLVVDRDRDNARLPEPNDLWTDILGIRIACIGVGSCADPTQFVLATLDAFESAFDDTLVTRT